MESQYNIEEWASDTTFGRRVFNYNFRMAGRELKGWEMAKVVPMREERTITDTVYLWQRNDARDRDTVRLEVAELHDWRAAQKHLLQMLQNSMHPNIPRGRGGSSSAGDVEFVARDPHSDVPAAIRFTRGNVAVSVDSVGQVNTDVSDIAEVVDRALTELPSKLAFLRGRSKQQAPKTIVIRTKQGVALVKNLRKFGDAWLKVIVPDGEVRRKDDVLTYLSPAAGTKAIKIFSINTGG